MKAALRAAEQDWQVWTIWYGDRLAGRVRDEECELAYVRIDDALWNQGPAVVNAEIKRRIEPQEQNPSPIEAKPEQEPIATRFGVSPQGLSNVGPNPPAHITAVDALQREYSYETRLKTLRNVYAAVRKELEFAWKESRASAYRAAGGAALTTGIGAVLYYYWPAILSFVEAAWQRIPRLSK